MRCGMGKAGEGGGKGGGWVGAQGPFKTKGACGGGEGVGTWESQQRVALGGSGRRVEIKKCSQPHSALQAQHAQGRTDSPGARVRPGRRVQRSMY